jgi:hypothetical protein
MDEMQKRWIERWVRAWFTVESKEGADGGAHFLLHGEVVVQGHLLHPRHQALVRVHWSPPQRTDSNRNIRYDHRLLSNILLIIFALVGSWSSSK